jgi:Rad3-related DNA helicase
MKLEFDLSKIPEYFPFDTFREGQLECIEFILKAFMSGKKYVVLEAPTGAGKSAIGMAVAKFFTSSYYLTVQKVLQTQIMKDFGSGEVVDLKGRSAYTCAFYGNFGKNAVARKAMFQKDLDRLLDAPPTCDKGYCRKKDKARRCELCFPYKPGENESYAEKTFNAMHHSLCPYYKQIAKTMIAKVAIMNYSSFLYQRAIAQRFSVRDLLIIDECHQAEPQLLDFISITIDDKRLQKLGYKLEEYEMPQEYYMSFKDNNILSKIQIIVDEAEEAEDTETADEYEGLVRKINAFYASIEEGEDWVAEFKIVEQGKEKNRHTHRSVVLKPIFVHSKSHKLMFNNGSNVLMMSATILDVDIFCYSLGIPRNQVAAYRMKNRFPVENRPIIVDSAARIVGGPAKMNEWAPKLVAKTDQILNRYENDRGIIHTHNFAIADYLMEKSRHRHRFLYQKRFATKEDMLRRHNDSDNTIIVAPALHEGLDLRGDLSRVQLICKVPWPNFMDNKQLMRRMELDRRYYQWLTALKLIQSCGRSIRSETDWAHTYVLDEVFNRFMLEAASMIPSWFKDAVNYGEAFKSEIQEIRSKPTEDDDIPF